MDFLFEEDDSLALPSELVSNSGQDYEATTTKMTDNSRTTADNEPTHNTLSFASSSEQASAPITLGKGLLSLIKSSKNTVTKEKNAFVNQKSISDELLLAQQAQSNLTATDRLIQRQILNTTIEHNIAQDLNKKKKVEKKKTGQARYKLDWDVSEDFSVDKYSLQSGTLESSTATRDHFGNIKRAKPNTNHLAQSAMPPLSDKLVVLGMDDDEEITVNMSTPAASSAYNLVTNTLGHTKTEKRQHLETLAYRTTPADSTLLPRNRELRHVDLRPWEEKTLDEMTPRDWTIFREEFQMLTRGRDIPNPLRFWEELSMYHVPTDLMDAINAMGYKHPTGIQRIAMPTALLNRDLIARAQTGSGKTCSFLVPVLTYISKQPALDERTCMDGPYGIILAPARELATQIYDEALKLTAFMSNSINVACVIGGKKEYSLNQRIELIVATPGRLDDLLEQRELVLNQCRYIILDEADKMLEEGFEVQVNRILAIMPSANTKPDQNTMPTSNSNLIQSLYQDKRRRTMLYSATFSAKIEELAQKYMQPDFVKVEVGDQTHKINKNVEQIIEWCGTNEDAKITVTCKYINQFPQDKVIIFCARKENCDNLCYRLGQISRQSQSYQNRRGGTLDGFRGAHFTHPVNPIVLHSDASDREANLRAFKDGDCNVLIATDLAGRGIDVKEVKLVVNYELPDIKVVITEQNKHSPHLYNSIFEAYTHRVGRTGRAGRTGTAVTLITDKERGLIPLFRNFLVKNGVKDFPRPFLSIADSGSDNRPITL